MATLSIWTVIASAQPFFPHYPTREVAALDGAWSFAFNASFEDPLDATIDAGAILTPETVTVPSAFDVAEPGVNGRRGTAFYRRQFTLAPAGRSGLLHFSACSFFCRVFVDGEDLGSHIGGGYVPFQIRVPSSPSTSRDLLVLVDNRFNATTAPLHTGGDFYMYGGITRSVLLHTLPADEAPSIDFLGVLPLNTTHVNVSVSLAGGSGAFWRVDFAFDGANASTTPAASIWLRSGFAPRTAAYLKVPHGKPWHPATPNLHTLTARVAESGDVAIARFGLRTVGVTADGRFALNGAPYVLKGVNRHTMSPASGSALTLDEVRKDVALLKELGVNYVRGAHYPQDQRFLDLCDEAGILIWEEALGPNVVTGASAVLSIRRPLGAVLCLLPSLPALLALLALAALAALLALLAEPGRWIETALRSQRARQGLHGGAEAAARRDGHGVVLAPVGRLPRLLQRGALARPGRMRRLQRVGRGHPRARAANASADYVGVEREAGRQVLCRGRRARIQRVPGLVH